MQRLDHMTLAPDGMKALGQVHGYIHARSGLPPQLVELVNLRASQINGCAYCIDMHARALTKAGMAAEKLMLVSVWREAESLFDDSERAALAWTESVTNLSATGAPDADFEAVSAAFSEKEVANLTIAIALINAYNRLGVPFRLTPESAKAPS